MDIIDDRKAVGMGEPKEGTFLYLIKEIWSESEGKRKDLLAILYDHLNALYVEQSIYRDGESVPMPINEDQASMMALLGHRWLQDNAPHRLTTPTPRGM